MRRAIRQIEQAQFTLAGNLLLVGSLANVIVVLIQFYSWYARYSQGAAAVVPKGLVLSLIVVCILGFTGWKGWDMVYRARVAVADAPEQTQSPSRRAA